MNRGLIEYCPSQNCNFRCCNRTARVSGIILYPDETENIPSNMLNHLEIGKEYKGGKLAKCKADDTATCDGGYKPLDCQMYPLLPKFKQGKVVKFKVHSDYENKKTTKCPLPLYKLKIHASIIARKLNPMRQLHSFFNSLPAVGYKNVLEVGNE